MVSIGSQRPTAGISQSVSDFVDTFNQMITEVIGDTNAQSGTLAQDSAARSLKRLLSQLTLTQLIPPNSNGAPTTLAEIGVATNRGWHAHAQPGPIDDGSVALARSA